MSVNAVPGKRYDTMCRMTSFRPLVDPTLLPRKGHTCAFLMLKPNASDSRHKLEGLAPSGLGKDVSSVCQVIARSGDGYPPIADRGTELLPSSSGFGYRPPIPRAISRTPASTWDVAAGGSPVNQVERSRSIRLSHFYHRQSLPKFPKPSDQIVPIGPESSKMWLSALSSRCAEDARQGEVVPKVPKPLSEPSR